MKHFFILKISENFSEIESDSILNKFYKDIYVSNKTSKKTSKNRFSDLDKISFELIKKTENPIIHDVAVSNGISSSDFCDLLKSQNQKCDFYISDKYSEVLVKKGFITKVFGKNKQLLFAYIGCFFAGDKNTFFPITVLLFRILQKNKLRNNYDYRLLLFHPKVLQKIADNTIKFIEYDIFKTEIIKNFTFVRVMNILNFGYFSEKKIISGILNIKKSIKEKGILLVGRTNADGINNASFFRKENGKLVKIKDINNGSEIKSLIDKL
ncbi:MAG: hypothetical protein L3J35_10415 [Bacteroidales bacterium]|nr:hypothetical protein [Bacteroidales bacterium]